MAAAIPAIAGLVGGVWANAANAREARRNRRFQERMSSSAHQREVADLRQAGVNPMLRAMGGASTPSGDRAEMRDPIGGPVSSAVMMKAQVGLIHAQTEREKAAAMLTQQQRFDLEGNPSGGMGRPARTMQDLRELDLEQRRALLPTVLERARQEIQQMVSSARASEARAILDEAAKASAENFEAFAKRLGEFGPAVQFALELLRALRGRR